MSTLVAGHELPEAVERWLAFARADSSLPERVVSLFASAWGLSVKYAYVLTLEHMRNHLYTFETMRDIGREEPGFSPWDAYGFEAASRTGSPVDLPILDLDLAVPLISCSSYREIWLDYRPTGGPRVVLGYRRDDDDSDDFGRTWTVIADSFEEFLSRYFPEVPSSTPE